ncbi:MAG: PilZ domain-containing protein [Deltaproteobacteria bacterium]|nr:PilZ domain-containing protein [Deltaproteobacteria bacterium]
MKHIERRLNKRHDCEASAVCSYFNTNRSFDAHILNFSESGLYLESRESLKPGATLLIMLKKCENGFSANKSTCLRSLSLAEVK